MGLMELKKTELEIMITFIVNKTYLGSVNNRYKIYRVLESNTTRHCNQFHLSLLNLQAQQQQQQHQERSSTSA